VTEGCRDDSYDTQSKNAFRSFQRVLDLPESKPKVNPPMVTTKAMEIVRQRPIVNTLVRYSHVFEDVLSKIDDPSQVDLML
jgi:hypothetical protein